MMSDIVRQYDIRELWRLMAPELEDSLSERISDTEVLIPAVLKTGFGDYILDCFEWCVDECLEKILTCKVSRHYHDDVWNTVFSNKRLSARFRNLLEQTLDHEKVITPDYWKNMTPRISTLVNRNVLIISGLVYEDPRRTFKSKLRRNADRTNSVDKTEYRSASTRSR